MDRTERLTKISRLGLGCNALLALLKTLGGFFGGSAALLADGFNSVADVGTDLAALWGLRLVRQPVDWDHPYGHGKFETLVAASMGAALLAIGGGMFAGGVRGFFSILRGETFERPDLWTIWIGLFTVGLKEWLYRRTKRAADETGSVLLLSKAWDHRSDSLATCVVLVGLAGALWFGRWGALLDPLGACAVSLLVISVGWKTSRQAFHELTDGAPLELEAKIVAVIRSCPGVISFHHLRFRALGGYLAMDFHILLSPDITLKQAHDIATDVEKALRQEFGPNTLVTIHEEPADRGPSN